MSVGKEDVKYLEIQDDFFVIKSHNPTDGSRVSGFGLLGANGEKNCDMFMAGGRKEIHIMNYSNASGTLYVHTGIDPTRISSESNANAWMVLPYAAVNSPQTWVVAVRSLVYKINYVNGATAQTTW